jgi:transposase-like protein
MSKIKDKDKSVDELANQLLDNAKTQGLSLTGEKGLLTKLTQKVLQTALEAEMDEHLGYSHNDRTARGDTTNFRNGFSNKKVKTEIGDIKLNIPRDRKGEFEPTIIPKHKRRITGFNSQVIQLYSSGLSTRDICEYLQNIYGNMVSPQLVSNVTDSILDELQQWKNRPLDKTYPVLFIDAIQVKVRDGSVANRPIYVAYAIDMQGKREVLSLELFESGKEGASQWMSMLTHLKNRGVEDVLIVCCDGLKGLPEAINATWSKATVQLCIVHMIRNALRYVPYKHMKEVSKDLKNVYSANSESDAKLKFNEFKRKYKGKYDYSIRTWENRWQEFVPFLDFPKEIRKLIYTTNAIESLNSRFRSAVQKRGHFPTQTSALKLLYLAVIRKDSYNNVQKKVFNWKPILNVLYCKYADRLEG